METVLELALVDVSRRRARSVLDMIYVFFFRVCLFEIKNYLFDSRDEDCWIVDTLR